MSQREVSAIAGRLSLGLGTPQTESLQKLATGVGKTRLMGAFISYLSPFLRCSTAELVLRLQRGAQTAFSASAATSTRQS